MLKWQVVSNREKEIVLVLGQCERSSTIYNFLSQCIVK